MAHGAAGDVVSAGCRDDTIRITDEPTFLFQEPAEKN
jgi:hypothetical protein